MVFERPRPNRNNPPANDNRGGHGGGNRGNGGNNNGGNQPAIPSPWLDADNEPKPHPDASFVEYLRWMRSASLSPNHDYKDPTKVQILQIKLIFNLFLFLKLIQKMNRN